MVKRTYQSPRSSLSTPTMIESVQGSTGAPVTVASTPASSPEDGLATGPNDRGGEKQSPVRAQNTNGNTEEPGHGDTTPNASKSNKLPEAETVLRASASPTLKPDRTSNENIVHVLPASPRPDSQEIAQEERDFVQDKSRLSVEDGSSLSASITSFQSAGSQDSYCPTFLQNEECRDPNCVYHNAQLEEEGTESPRRLSWLPPSRPRSMAMFTADPTSFKRQSSMSSNMAPAFDMFNQNHYPRGMALSRQSSIRSTGTFASIGTMPPRQSFDMKHYGDSEHSFRNVPDGSIMRVMPNQQMLRQSSTMSSVHSSIYGDFYNTQRAPPAYTDLTVYLQSSSSPTHPPSEAASLPEAEADTQRPNLRRKSHFESGTVSGNGSSDVPARHPSWKPGGESAFSVLRRHSSATPETQYKHTSASHPAQNKTNRRRRIWPPSLEDTEVQQTQPTSQNTSEPGPKEQNLGSVAEGGTKSDETAKRHSLGRSATHSTNHNAVSRSSAMNYGHIYPHYDPNPSQSYKLPLPGEPADDGDQTPDISILQGKSAKAKAYSKLFRDMTADYMEIIAERETRISERDHIILALRLEVDALKTRLSQAAMQAERQTQRSVANRDMEKSSIRFPPLTARNISVLKKSLKRRAEKLKKQSQDALRFSGMNITQRPRPPLKVATTSGLQGGSHSNEASPVTVKMSRSQNSSLDNFDGPLPKPAGLQSSNDTSPLSIRTVSYSAGNGVTINGVGGGSHNKSRSLGEYELLSASPSPLARLERQNKIVLERLKRAEAEGFSQTDLTAELLEKLESLDLEREKERPN